MKRVLVLITLSLMVFSFNSEAANRTGSHRVGGTNSHGKHSHYVGGVNRHPSSHSRKH